MNSAQEFWTLDRGHETQPWLDHYWTSINAPHRDTVVELVGGAMSVPDAQVLEVGCHVGPNIYRLLTAFPKIFAHGVDLSVEAVIDGTDRLVSSGLGDRCHLTAGAFPYATQAWDDDAVDVVFSCYALAYIEPSALPGVLDEMCRLAKTAVVLVEPEGTGEAMGRGTYREWRHDYGATLGASDRLWRRHAEVVSKKLSTFVIDS